MHPPDELESLKKRIEALERDLIVVRGLEPKPDPKNKGVCSDVIHLTDEDEEVQKRVKGDIETALAADHRLQPFTICGADQRTREVVTQESDHKRKCTCLLEGLWPSGATYRATGFLVAPRVVATAGHCVYNPAEGGWCVNMLVTPGANSSARAGGPGNLFYTGLGIQFFASYGWTSRQSRPYDFGAIILRNDRPYQSIGQQVFTLRSLTVPHADLCTFGYPGDKPTGHLYSTPWETHNYVANNPSVIMHTLDTVGGQSGSPILWDTNYDPVLGIHVASYDTCQPPTWYNTGVWLTQDRIHDYLVDWNPDA